MNTYREYTQYLLDQIPIESVVEKLGRPVVRAGKENKCLCFFHNDTRPSMTLYKSRQYHCYSCGAHGNIFTLVQTQKNVDFKGAVEWLEEEFPYVKEERPKPAQKQPQKQGKPEDPYLLAFETFKNMDNEEQHELSLFAEKRKLSEELLKKLDIYCVKQGHLILEYGDNISRMESLEASSLLRQNQKGYYEFFTERVLITLRNQSGKIIGYAGRSIKDEKMPKYLFTPQLPKDSFLYLLNEVKTDVGSEVIGNLFLVEGAFDAIRLKSLGKDAVAVLGAHILGGQAEVLAEFIKASRRKWNIHVFMDSDQAGIRGARQTIYELCQNPITRQCLIQVVINKRNLAVDKESAVKEAKDPDEIFKDGNTEIENFLRENTFGMFEFLMRYEIDTVNLHIKEELKGIYKTYSPDQRVVLLGNVHSFFSADTMQEILKYYRSIFNVDQKGNEEDDNQFAIRMLSGYGLKQQGVIFDSKKLHYASDEKAVMQNAVYIAESSYRKQEPPLDDDTWERILLCSDVFVPYLLEEIGRLSHQKTPRLAFYMPKRIGEYRIKSLYVHESLIMQQYMLNELLRRDENIGFERSVLAVRYNPKEKQEVWTTGKDYYEFFQDSDERLVSFAYQIDMLAINSEKGDLTGMFRPYQECWGSFVSFIKEGLDRFGGDTYYLVRLDIEKFYDSIPEYAVRRTLTDCLAGLNDAANRFEIFNGTEKTEEKKRNIVQWFLDELFGSSYISPEDGSVKEGRPLVGIPQGPNLSAYIANILLFPMDYEVQEYVRRQNRQGQMHVRYARYVDDMVIIADDPDYIHDMEVIISEHLYEINLSLSSKTDEARKFTKEDAIDWMVDRRGGLGISDILDDDETLDTQMDGYENINVFNRKDGLDLLRALGTSLDYLMQEADDMVDDTVRTIFRMENPRYTDIIWTAKILLRRSVKTIGGDGVLWNTYEAEWEKGKEDSEQENLFMAEGMEYLSFIFAGRSLLMQYKANGGIYGWEQKETDALIAHFRSEDYVQILDQKKHIELIQKNYMVLGLYLTHIKFMTKEDGESENDIAVVNHLEQYDNIYAERWKYMLTAAHEKGAGIRSSVRSVTDLFHYCVYRLLLIDGSEAAEQYRSIEEEVVSGYPDIDIMVSNSRLSNCIKVWFSIPGVSDDQEIRTYVFLLYQLLKRECMAEIVAGRDVLRRYTFSDDMSGYEFLPVVQGIQYPGLLAVKFEPSNCRIQRVDFLENAVVTGKNKWIEKENKITDVRQYRADVFLETANTLEQYLALDIREANEKDILCWIGRIIEIYDLLVDKIRLEQTDAYLVIPSYSHVFVVTEDGRTDIRIITYKTENIKTGAGIGVKVKGNLTIPKLVSIHGKELWQAGLLVENVLKLKEKKLWANEKETIGLHIQFLEYVLRRLTGKSVDQNKIKFNNTGSFKATVNRIKSLTKMYIENSQGRSLYLLECKIQDSFIAERMRLSKTSFKNGELLLFVTNWAENFLKYHYKEISELLTGKNRAIYDMHGNVGIERRKVNVLGHIAMGLEERIESEISLEALNKLNGIRTLIHGIYALSVVSAIRTQVLEIICSLSEKEREELEQFRDFSVSLLDLEGMDEIIFCGGKSNSIERLQSVCKNFLKQKPESNYKQITPIGWRLILAWLLKRKISGEGEWNDFFREEERMQRTKSLLNLEWREEEGEPYPFEQLKGFIAIWNRDEFEKWRSELKKIDDVCGFKVYVVKGEFFRYKITKGDVRINTGTCYTEAGDSKEYRNEMDISVKMPEYFFSYFCFSDRNLSVERQGDEYIFTETLYKNRVVGISAVEDSVAFLVKGFTGVFHGREEGAAGVLTVIGPEEMKENLESGIERGKEENKNHKNMEGNDETGRDISVEEKDEDTFLEEKNKDEYIESLNHVWGNIRKKRDESLGERAELKRKFKNTDRIALFQFNIDNSYFLPNREICGVKGNKENSLSCGEYRRRQLLDNVFKICEKSAVDILLLPEYSVRPETVRWISEELENNKDYKFSVWAGTFRIFPGYTLPILEHAEEKVKRSYYYAAVLPVVCNRSDSPYGKTDKAKEIHTIYWRFKNYPAVNLKEIVNPVTFEKDMFKPVIKRYYRDFLFGDARDDVTELICAELFMITSPSNINTFAERAKELSNTLTKTKISFEDMKNKAETDIRAFGDATSFNRTEDRYGRTPIVLVPACTTRMVDYYLNAQANYLAAGLTTVFCNAVDGVSNGGSCFIGQNSWDDNKFMKNKLSAPGSNIYHGCEPGIFQQSNTEGKDHGALGKDEQALVICDINPGLMKGSPNPESMVDQLRLVAHIPFAEVDVTQRENEENKQGKCRCQKGSDNSIKLSEVKVRCKGCKDCSAFGRLCGVLERLNEYIQDVGEDSDKILSTAEDKRSGDAVLMLKELGEIMRSPGFIERAEKYGKNYIEVPYSFPSPVALDFSIVQIDYGKMGDDVKIQTIESVGNETK